ncbi:MAG: helix-turn-helix domain-containing protein [Pirellulales bacterium]
MKAEYEPLALRPREAAKALGVSDRTLWSWTHHGDIPHLRIGRTVLYPVEGLQAWLRSRSQFQATEGGHNG